MGKLAQTGAHRSRIPLREFSQTAHISNRFQANHPGQTFAKDSQNGAAPIPALPSFLGKGEHFGKKKLVKLICDSNFFSFFLLETCWSTIPDSMMLLLFQLFQTNTLDVFFCFLVKNILDTDLTMDFSPPVFLVSNSPYVPLTCWSVCLLSIASHILLFFFFYWTTATNPQRNK